MTTRVHSIILLSWGAVLIRLACGDALLRYVRPGVRLLVLGAGVLIAALAARWLFGAAADGPADGTSEDARSGPRMSRAGWLALAPVIAVAVAAPPALGVLTAGRRPVAPPRPHGALAALPATDPVPVALGDIVVRSVWDHGRTLRARRLRTVGFVSRVADGGFVLTRLVITCCAADAEPNSIAITASGAAPPRGAWVEVTGRFVGMSATDSFVPSVRAEAVRPIRAPPDPYG